MLLLNEDDLQSVKLADFGFATATYGHDLPREFRVLQSGNKQTAKFS